MSDRGLIAFPPRRRYLVLPRRPVRASLNGMALYDGTEFHQRVAERIGRAAIRLGAGGAFGFGATPPLPDREWWEAWLAAVGPSLPRPAATAAWRLVGDDFATTGATCILFDDDGRPLVFAKFTPSQLVRPVVEEVLRRFTEHPPAHFAVPRLLDAGIHGPLHYVVQEPLPEGRHRRPRRDTTALPAVVDELQGALGGLVPLGGAPAGWVPAHGSLTPPHLRVGADGGLWLVDWEKVGAAPRLGDELRYWVADYGSRPWPSVAARADRVVAHLLARGDRNAAREALRWREGNAPREVLPATQAVRDAVRVSLGPG